MIKPDAMNRMGEILKLVTDHDFHISNMKMVRLSEQEVEDFHKSSENCELQYVLRMYCI